MDYQLKTHCPDCFKPSNTAICASCHFDREAYLDQHAAAHHLPLFSCLEKGYVVGRVLGEGSFGIVYAGIREKDQLSSAIKEYYPPDLAQRGLDNKTIKSKQSQELLAARQNSFIQAAELLRSCYDYPSVESGVVRYTALIKQHNTAYLVMERLKGITLGETLRQQKQLSAEQICLWLQPLLETLEKLHAKEIYHLDINPNSIFLAAADKPVLMDFGLARAGIRDESLKPSDFIAPEQLTDGYFDQRTDLYALGAVIYRCLQGEALPPVEARRQGATLKSLNSVDKTVQVLQTITNHCLQLNLNLRPKNSAYLLAQLSECFADQAPDFVPAPSLETLIPSRYSEPPVLRVNPAPNPFLSPLPAKPQSFFHGLVLFLCILGSLIGLAYGGFIAYQNYDLKESEQRKQDNLLFAKAQTIADYKSYLASCTSCESQQRALEKIAQLEQEQQSLLSQQKQHEQEALLFSKALTAEDFKTYLSSCVQCADKPKADEKLAQFNAASKQADEKQLAEQTKEMTATLAVKEAELDFYQQACPKNLPFWQRTAEQGYAAGQLLLAGCYRSGAGVKQDYAEAIKWYGKAAEQGNPYAQGNLAMLYQKGSGIAKSDKEAAKWYLKAAEQGQASAQYSLGVMNEKGQGVAKNYKQAVDWYLRAAEQENVDAQYNLGLLYHYGSGVTQDYQAALLWYRKSAGHGNDKAQYMLGIMYQHGYGVPADEQEALNWYQKAASLGNPDAIGEVKALEAMDNISGTAKTPETVTAEPIR